jgi:serine/threonine-protein kinase HipA
MGKGPNHIQPQRAKLAMALRSKNTHHRLTDIQARHWQALALQSGVPDAFAVMVRLVEHVAAALELVEKELPMGFPEHVWVSISAGMLRHRRRFLDGLKTQGGEAP